MGNHCCTIHDYKFLLYINKYFFSVVTLATSAQLQFVLLTVMEIFVAIMETVFHLALIFLLVMYEKIFLWSTKILQCSEGWTGPICADYYCSSLTNDCSNNGYICVHHLLFI